MSELLTPNVKELMIRRVAMEAIPLGCPNGLLAGIDLLLTPGKLFSSLKSAHEWVKASLQAVRDGGEPNQWKTATDEEIAGEILRRIKERSGAKRG
jgi:hypothetical protein